jgi:hypothetical protein
LNTKSRRWTWWPAVLGFALAAGLAGWLNTWPSPWAGWARDGCEIANCYCEPLTDGFIAQPIAAFSNLGFILAGLLMLATPLDPTARSLMRAQPAFPRLFALTALGTGVGSFFYHASLTRLGEWLDLVGLYLFTSFLLVYNLARLGRPPRSHVPWVALYAGLNIAGGAQMFWAREWQQVVFGLLAAGALAVEALVLIRRRLSPCPPERRERGAEPPANGGPRVQWGFLVAALVSFGLGVVLWVTPCSAGLPFPPHAGWHVLAAATQGWLFAYYRSEQP